MGRQSGLFFLRLSWIKDERSLMILAQISVAGPSFLSRLLYSTYQKKAAQFTTSNIDTVINTRSSHKSSNSPLTPSKGVKLPPRPLASP